MQRLAVAQRVAKLRVVRPLAAAQRAAKLPVVHPLAAPRLVAKLPVEPRPEARWLLVAKQLVVLPPEVLWRQAAGLPAGLSRPVARRLVGQRARCARLRPGTI